MDNMRCNICDAEQRHLANELYVCDACELISSDLTPDPSIYDRSYDIKYQRYARSREDREINRVRLQTVQEAPEVIQETAITSLLDFGCGAGSFVKYVENLGISAHGFDINPYSGYCDVAELLSKRDAVTFWDSIEHVADPRRIIAGIGAPWVFVCSPSTDDFGGLHEHLENWHHYYPEEHFHYFNEKSLCLLLEACGYDIILSHHDESDVRRSGGDKNIVTVAAYKSISE